MQSESVWAKDLNNNRNIKELRKDIRTGFLIVGGGIAGILCALKLKEAGVSCIVVEEGRTLNGVTRNTTAKITAQHGLIYNKIAMTYGSDKARQYYDINKLAVNEYEKLSKDIDCDFEKKTAYVYSTDNPDKLEQEAQIYEKIKIPHVWQDKQQLPINTCGALGIENQAQFNPIKFLQTLTEKMDIYENAKVLEIKDGQAVIEQRIGKDMSLVTERHTVKAEQIILATHFPMINIPGGYFAKMYQSRSYAMAVKDGGQLNGMYIDENTKGFSFRNYKDYLIVGGGSHKTGTSRGGYRVLEDLVLKKYPDKKVDFAWAAQDCMTLDGIPYIGHHSKRYSDIYVATGFNKWGITGAMSAAIVLQQLLIKGESEYMELFSPKRSMVHPQLAVNLASAVGNIVSPGKKCTHMGCTLHWNKEECSWDCPCHGSRFGKNGKVLENPAKRDKKMKG